MIGVVIGAFLIALGLIPGLFQGFVDGVRNFVSLWSSEFQAQSCPPERIDQPAWLVAVGTALMTLTILAYLSN